MMLEIKCIDASNGVDISELILLSPVPHPTLLETPICHNVAGT